RARAMRIVTEDLLELREMLPRERRPHPKARHISTKVIDPDLLRVALLRLTSAEEEYVGLHALGIEDSRGQPQDGMKVAFVHEVRPDLLPGIGLEEHVVGHHYRRPAAGLEGSVDVLQERELLVRGGIGKVVPRRTPSALLGAEGRVREDYVCPRKLGTL